MSVLAGRGGVVSDGLLARDANAEIIQQYWDAGTVVIKDNTDANTVLGSSGRYFQISCLNQTTGTAAVVTVTGNNLFGVGASFSMAPGATLYGDFTNVTISGGVTGSSTFIAYRKL